jgi:Ran GTPase-activating protein (RanGAP) involved in mRNA processing and transport
MSDTYPDAGSISDASNSRSNEAPLMSVAVREFCNRLRANDPDILDGKRVFKASNILRGKTEAECIEVFQALKENTSVTRIDLSTLYVCTERSILVAAEYVESSKTLQTLEMSDSGNYFPHEASKMISSVIRALSRNTSVTKIVIRAGVVRFACVAFQELLTRTQTLQKLEIIGYDYEAFNEVQTAAIVSGFANNTTLRDLEFNSWRDADLAPVLTALHDHPVLQKICFHAHSAHSGLSGLEVLLRSQASRVKELILEQVSTRTVGLHSVLQELARNTTVTKLAIRKSVLSHESTQQLKALLRQNTALQSLDLSSSALGSAGLAEISQALYRNTSIKTLDLSCNGLGDIEAAYMLREVLRHNKTIASLCFSGNKFGSNAAATQSIFEGLCSNTALQQLDLGLCELGDQGVSLLVNALAIRNASILELDLGFNGITSVGVGALVDDNVEAVKTLTKLCLTCNDLDSDAATILADALGRNAIPSLKHLCLDYCGIDDDGFVALVSALEQNTTLNFLDLTHNPFGGEWAFMSLAESLPNIKRLQQITFSAGEGLLSTLPLLMEGFRKNTSLVEVDMDEDRWCVPTDCGQKLKFLAYRNRFTPLLKACDPPGASPWLGIWSRALAKVTTEPDVLFHILRNKPKLVGSTGGLKKRKRDVE